MATDPLTVEADELYGLVPEEFTAARNARAKELRAEDRELAGRIAELRKPSPAAWILNQLLRDHGDAVDELLELGDELRDAQSAGDGKALTQIGSERRRLIAALLNRAGELADAADRSPSRAVLDEVEQTLIAATVDAAASDALRTGRLVRSLQAVGFEEVELDGAVAGETSAARPAKRKAPQRRQPPITKGKARGVRDDEAAEREAEQEAARRAEAEQANRQARERAEADVREARERAEAAQRALAEAEDLLHAAEWNADELRDERHELEARLKELRTEIADAERDEREAERVRTKAATAADRARDDVEAAEAALEQLG